MFWTQQDMQGTLVSLLLHLYSSSFNIPSITTTADDTENYSTMDKEI